ncbi:hypothetical protein ANN_10127 [Periplaneta americana]|uniref:Uncharacterized protein n=1 Tax=Periplaneta americana TaxID=6978 RepID=A0ABQ8TQW9_PERAM|nr:hypothetical protein ANN_10127 [Periplaneta americana]
MDILTRKPQVADESFDVVTVPLTSLMALRYPSCYVMEIVFALRLVTEREKLVSLLFGFVCLYWLTGYLFSNLARMNSGFQIFSVENPSLWAEFEHEMHKINRKHAYLTLVRPLMEYGTTCWDPYRIYQLPKCITMLVGHRSHTLAEISRENFFPHEDSNQRAFRNASARQDALDHDATARNYINKS